MMKKIFCTLVSLFVLMGNSAQAVIVSSLVELHFSIEDGDMKNGSVTQVKFNDEEIDLTGKTFMHRVVNKVMTVSPGKYSVDWVVEKSDKPWGEKKSKKFKRLIEFELTDAVVYIVIRGDTFTTY